MPSCTSLGVGLLALVLPSLAGAQGVSNLHFEADGTTLSESDLADAMNLAGCRCGRALQVVFDFTHAGTEGGLRVLTGRGCVDDEGALDTTCRTLARLRLESADSAVTLSTDVDAVLGGCDADEGDDTLYVVADVDDQDVWTELASLAFPRDTDPPDAPTGGAVVAGETLAEVAYTLDDDAETSTRYQVLCKADGEAVFTSPPTAAFTSAEDECGATGDVKAAYVCAKATTGADSVTVTGLTDGVTYSFWVVAVDDAGNPSKAVAVGTATPAAEEDLFERYKAAGGVADGGHCFIATAAYGDYGHPQVRTLRALRDQVLAPGPRVHLDVLRPQPPRGPGDRGRPRLEGGHPRPTHPRRLAGRPGHRGAHPMSLAVLLTALLATQVATEAPTEPLGLRVGFSFGPYAPDVDREFKGAATPYGDLFGDSTGWLLRPKVGWVRPLPFGELTLTGALGWFKDSANAFVQDSEERSGGTTTIRLIPLSAQVGLRVYVLEAWLGLPVHPYLEVGPSYTFWRITRGDGAVATVDGARASGGALGLSGAAGLALALERLDPRGARVLRESYGVHGADLFFEWDYGRTLPIFADSLEVGGSNWQAGLQLTF
jgi:hypothetical protein